MGMRLYGGYRQRALKYKGMTFILQRASDGAGWYCDRGFKTKDNRVVETDYFTSGDTHYYRLTDVMKGIKREIDSNKFSIIKGRFYRKSSQPQK